MQGELSLSHCCRLTVAGESSRGQGNLSEASLQGLSWQRATSTHTTCSMRPSRVGEGSDDWLGKLPRERQGEGGQTKGPHLFLLRSVCCRRCCRRRRRHRAHRGHHHGAADTELLLRGWGGAVKLAQRSAALVLFSCSFRKTIQEGAVRTQQEIVCDSVGARALSASVSSEASSSVSEEI